MTKRHLIRIGLALVLALLLAVPMLLRKFHEPPADAGEAVSAATSPDGFRFTEVANAVGIDFKHRAPTLDPKLAPIMPEVASLGASVSIVDFDRDGWPDIYLTNSAEGSRNALYRNLHDGTFKDVAMELGIADVNQVGTGVSMAAVWGDFDNDGYEDLLLVKWGRTELFRNVGGKSFERVTETAGLPKWMNANAAVWFDYDGDGLLDFFIGGFYREDLDLWKLNTTKIMPDSFEYATNGGRKYLFHNLGGGRFEEVSEKMGISSRRWALAAAATDLRGTGRPDLFIANDYGVSELYVNDGQRFREVGKPSGIGAAPKSGMNAAFGDIYNEGHFAIYVSNISEDGILIQGNNLWVRSAGTAAGEPRYDNLARESGVELGGWSFGAQFGDLNNDGSQDLYLTNGYISLDRQRSYWYDFSKVAGGNSLIIGDAKHWPAFDGRSLSGYQTKRVWVNDGSGRFRDVAQQVGVTDVYDGRAVALADLWNRGVLDAVVANQNGPALVYRNAVRDTNRWIAFELEGRASNRSAIGAQLTLFWNGMRQVQTVAGASGFAAQNDRRLHFGLGPQPRIERAEVRWPSGQRQTLDAPQVNQLHRIREPA
jgi:enediyne biosynthesis protein E4